MDFEKNKFYIYFVDLFPSIILRNPIVANIVKIVGIKLLIKKESLDKTLNTDI